MTKSKIDSLKEIEPRRFLVVERRRVPAAGLARVPRRSTAPLRARRAPARLQPRGLIRSEDPPVMDSVCASRRDLSFLKTRPS